MTVRSEFRQALRDRDVPLLMKASRLLFPADKQPKDEAEATAMIHIARTQQTWMRIDERAYSHFWLVERGIPSLLPPELLPKAERYRPTVEHSVGIACDTGKDWLKPALPLIESAMVGAVTSNQELIQKDPDRLRDEIHFARKDEFKRLFGVLTPKEVDK